MESDFFEIHRIWLSLNLDLTTLSTMTVLLYGNYPTRLYFKKISKKHNGLILFRCVRRMRPAVRGILINHMFFFFDKSCQACREWVLGEPVGGAHFHGNETAGDFVFAAGAGFEFLNIIFNCVVDALVKAGFKMQMFDFFNAAPVAAVKRGVGAEH